MKKIPALIYHLSQGNPLVFGIMLISAFFVTLARLFAPVELSWDPTVQLDAAHRLVQGLGLTTTVFPIPQYINQIPANLNQAPIPQYLTSFPPGFSLLVASLVFLGIPLASSLKILYSLATLMGWFGWAIIGSHCLSQPLRFWSIYFPAQLLLAAILPIFNTPAWVGTDIFLWSALPLMILFIFNSSSRKVHYVVAAGLIFGFQVSVRYAALFFALAGLVILFQVNFPKKKSFIKDYLIFIVTSLIFILPLAIYIKLANQHNGITGLPQVSLESQYSGFFQTIIKVLQSSSAIANITGLPLEPDLAYVLKPSPYIYSIGAFFLIFIFLLPLVVLKRENQLNIEETGKDIPLAISIIPLSIFLFLLACNFAGQYDFVGTPRYYVPAFLPTLFVSYQLATVKSTKSRKSHKSIKSAFAIFILILLTYEIILTPLNWTPGGSLMLTGTGNRLFQSVIQNGLKFRGDYRYPSNKVITFHDETSAQVRKLQKEHPEALFFVQEYPFYVYDGHPGLRVIPVKEFWKRAYVDKAVKVFWVVGESCPAVCTEHGSPVDRLSSLPGLKTVFTSSQENREHMKILVSDLPSGYRF